MAAKKGNDYAHKAKLWEAAIRRALARVSNDSVNGGLDMLAGRLVSQALQGDQWAIIEIANRIDGKPAQAVTVSGDEDAPVRVEGVIRFDDPNA